MKRHFIFFLLMIISATGVWGQSFPKPPCTTIVGDAMLKEVDTTGNRGVSDNYHTWDNGAVLLVKFMPGGSQSLRNKVIEHAKEWEKYANITFKFVADSTKKTDIRVMLGKGYGHNSAVGTEANYRPQSQQTVNFDTLYFADADYYVARLKNKGIAPPYNFDQLINEMRLDPNHWNEKELGRVVTHEFGHALGLLHEQSFPDAIHWKKTDSVYNYYYQTQGWDRAKVDFNVFNVVNQFCTNGTQYDPLSIMHYAVESWQTTDGYSLKDNYVLSSGDKKLIAALYPKGKKESDRAVPKVTISNFTKLDVKSSATKKGLIIKPTFDLKTNSKLGDVYFVARLADEDGYYLKTDNLYYNWGGTPATYIKVKLLPNSKISYNKNGKNNMELFLPYDQIPDLEGQKIMVVFAVYLDDVVNNQMNNLMYFSTTNPLSIAK